MALFVRLAAKARAAEAIQRDQQITLSQQDFKAFHAAIAQPFEPNAALHAREPWLRRSSSTQPVTIARSFAVASPPSIAF